MFCLPGDATAEVTRHSASAHRNRRRRSIPCNLLRQYVQGEEENKELLKNLPDRTLNLGEVYVLDHEADTHSTPKVTGIIEKKPISYQVIPVETLISGEAFDDVEEKHLVCCGS
jgi:hypothetical protein